MDSQESTTTANQGVAPGRLPVMSWHHLPNMPSIKSYTEPCFVGVFDVTGRGPKETPKLTRSKGKEVMFKELSNQPPEVLFGLATSVMEGDIVGVCFVPDEGAAARVETFLDALDGQPASELKTISAKHDIVWMRESDFSAKCEAFKAGKGYQIPAATVPAVEKPSVPASVSDNARARAFLGTMAGPEEGAGE